MRAEVSSPYPEPDYFPSSAIRWGLPAALVSVAFTAIAGLFGGFVVIAVGLRSAGVTAFVLDLVVYGALAAFALYLSRRRGLGTLTADFGLLFRWIDLVTGFGLAVAYTVVTAVVNALVTAATDHHPAGNAELSPNVLWNVLSAITAILIAPFVEELLVRGLLMRSIRHRILRSAPHEPTAARRGAAVTLSILVSALVFAGLHLHESKDLVSGVALGLITFLFGAGLALVATRTGRLGPGIVAHAFSNAIVVVLLLVTAH